MSSFVEREAGRRSAPGGLEEWYAGFQGRINPYYEEPPEPVKVVQGYTRLTADERDRLPWCTICNHKHVSQGSTKISRRAREQGLCITCYKATRPSREQLNQETIKKYGMCIKCKDRAVAGGKSRTAVYARRKRICVDCYTGGRRRGK